MRCFLAAVLLVVFNLLGVFAHDCVGVPLPGNVIGLLLLLLALSLRVVKLHHVESAADLLLKHMMLFFAPLIVGTLGMTALLANNWLPLVATVVLSTLVTLVATAGIACAFLGGRHE